MMRNLLILLLFIPCLLQARVIPAEGSIINYRLAGFTASALEDAPYYRLEVATGTYNTDKDFEKNVIIKVEHASKQMIQLLPEFGKTYTWRLSGIKAKGSKKIIATTPLCHFSTGMVPEVDTTKNRLRIIDPATAHKDMLLITDNMAVMYNMMGEPVWYLPELKDATQKSMRYRDLKPTADGTFTALCSDGIYEFDYNGNVLWQGPLNKTPRTDGIEYYHHDFTKLPGGHYMILANELIKKKIPAGMITSDRRRADAKDGMLNIVAGTIIEYDSAGSIVWQWQSADKFTDEEYFSFKSGKDRYEPNTHMNGAYYDDKNKEMFISFRNINTVMKIAYPSGRVICRYGFNEPYFKGQHSPAIASDGMLYLFNNNTTARQQGEVSYIAKYALDGCSLVKKWEFGCDIDTNTKTGTMVGGGAEELPNGDMLVCVGNAGRIFIVSPQKKLLWNVIAENKLDGNEKWAITSAYRASSIPDIATISRFIFRDN